jgi:uncharacterized membrane protein
VERDYSYTKDKITKMNKRISKMKKVSFIDFQYFSGTIMTTLGIGDILPNSTFTRGWVLSEIIISVFLVIFGVNCPCQALL